ncbi:SRPBCC family protein [Brucella sp. JSBI001]|uniref:SRPBCC family protein n=1 Tax=Brucella sp. JSBI001 TaxID=2886044 RepID=UPI0022322A7E|nr:SRPBCC family protein [Brucella sp. JSBI001]UZD69386.1 SRPBCC domain-containing protein [Brucella sp. JSBI001]
MTALSVSVTKSYDASPSEVFAAWSNPDETRRWWGPKDFTATIYEADVREGGVWQAVITNDGESLGQSGRYLNIEPDRRLQFTFNWEDGEDDQERTITVKLMPDGAGTMLTFSNTPYASKEDRDNEQSGWEECLARLGDYLEVRNG